MRLSYHHANPGGGNESFLLRYQSDPTANGGVCVLVDAGDDIDPTHILRPEDELVAICLTHAHLDHYRSLDTCRREETTIYASEPTAAILDDVFAVAARDYDVTTTDATTRAIEAIDGWTELAPGLAVHTIPAGHVPGAVGYLFRLDDGEQTRHVLATGDFTERRAGGYPGLDASLYLDIDVLFLTVATNTDFERNLSDGLARALQRAHSGAPTLVATSGLLGVHVAYLLDELTTTYERAVPIRVVGQVAKLYETLEYDCPSVESIPVFDDPEECLAPGTITIAGPEIPHERSSGRLFGRLCSNPSACVIQLLSSGEDPIEESTCTIDAYPISNHPPPETIDAVHDTIDPHYTVIVHRHRGSGSEFNDLNSIVWSPTDADEYVLYEDGQWISPPWMPQRAVRPSPASNMEHLVGDEVLGALSLPSLSRHDTVDVEAEGLDLARVKRILAQRDAYDTQTEPTEQPVRTDNAEHTTAATAPDHDGSTPMASEDRDPTDSDEASTQATDNPEPSPAGLVDPITPGIENIDEQLVAAVKAGDLEIEDIMEVQRLAEAQVDPTENAGQASEQTGTPATDPDLAPENEVASDTPGEADPQETADAENDEVADEDTTNANDDSALTLTDTRGSSTVEPSSDTDGDPKGTGDDPGNDPSMDAEREPVFATDPDTVDLTLSPLTVALATAAVDAAEVETVEAFVVSAVQGYLRGLLDETVTAPDSPPAEVRIEGGAGLDRALETMVEQTEAFDDISDLLTMAVADTIAPDTEPTLAIPRLAPYLPLVDAIVENDRYPVTSRAGVVAIAVQHSVAEL